MVKIELKLPSDKLERKWYKHQYTIFADSEQVGTLYMIKKFGYMLVNFITIDSEFRRKGYGLAVIDYILRQYKIKGIVCEVLDNPTSIHFWNKCKRLYTAKKFDTTYYNNVCYNIAA